MKKTRYFPFRKDAGIIVPTVSSGKNAIVAVQPFRKDCGIAPASGSGGSGSGTSFDSIAGLKFLTTNLTFTGSNSVIFAPATNISSSSEATFLFKFKTTATSGTQEILTAGFAEQAPRISANIGGSLGYYWLVGGSGSNYLQLVSSQTIQPNTDYLVSIRVTSATVASIRVNGVAGTLSSSGSLSAVNSIQYYKLGKPSSFGVSNCTISFFAFYEVALSDADIISLGF
jgi:hypothetical protein